MLDCTQTVVKASGGKLTDAEADAVIATVRGMQRRIEAEGKIAGADERLRQLALEAGERAKIEAALQAKHAALNAIKRAEIETFVGAYVAKRPGKYQDAILAYLEGSNRQLAGARKSVAATALGYERWFHGNIMGRIAKERPHVEKMLGDEAFNLRVAREMETPGITGDADAAFLGKVYAETAELSRSILNRLGANIGKLDGWRPQSHDAWRLLRAGRDAWLTTIKQELDLARSFPDAAPEEIDGILSGIYDTIVSGKAERVTAREKGERTGPANLAKKLGEHRVLHFRDTEAWQRYNKAFGYGNLSASMFQHLQRAARLAGQMERLGPNPQAMLASLAESLTRDLKGQLKGLDGKKLMKAKRQIDALRNIESWNAWGVMTGLTSTPVDYSLAAAGGAWRAWQSMSKLGGAVIASITDPVNVINNLRHQGRPFLDTWARVFTGYLRGRGQGEQRHVAFLLGEGYQGLIDQHLTRYSIMDTPPGWISRGMTGFFKWSGLTGFTDTGRAVASRIMAADMGRLAEKGWDALPERYRLVLEQQGIDQLRWDVIRQTAWRGENGTAYVTPDRLAELPDEQVDRLIEGRLDDTGRAFAERERRLRAADERETEWVDRRLAKLRDYVARSQDRLAKLREEAKARNENLAAETADQIKLLEVTVDWAVAEADLMARMSSFRDQDAMRRLLDEVQDGEASVDVAARADRGVERATARGVSAGREIGRKIATARRQASELRKKVRQAERRATSADKRRGEAFADTLARREDETRAFIKQVQERRQQREAILNDLPRQQADRIAKLRAEARQQLQLDLHRFYADEAAYGIIEVDAAARRFVTLGSRPGTAGGEAIRAIMQFKGFPIAFTQRVLGRALFAGPTGLAKGLHIGEMMAGLFVAGLFAMWGKDIAAGKSPKELVSDDGDVNFKTLAAAMIQGGGAGIYGDFLFAETTRFGGSPLETLAGPAFGEAGQVLRMLLDAKNGDVKAGDWLNAAVRNTPFANLFYVKPALDMLFLNSIREAISPGYLKRQERRAKEDYGQTYLLPREAF